MSKYTTCSKGCLKIFPITNGRRKMKKTKQKKSNLLNFLNQKKQKLPHLDSIIGEI